VLPTGPPSIVIISSSTLHLNTCTDIDHRKTANNLGEVVSMVEERTAPLCVRLIKTLGIIYGISGFFLRIPYRQQEAITADNREELLSLLRTMKHFWVSRVE
jgi:hypothetical protein